MKASQKNRPRRLTSNVLVVVAALLLLAPQALWPGAPARAQVTSAAPIRFEGYIRAQSPTKWMVGNDLEGNRIVNVANDTPIIKKNGLAQLGAWVIVYASVRESGELDALLIEVDRPAGARGPQIQFVGKVVKIGEKDADGSAWWIVDDTPVLVMASTRISGTITIGAIVWVGAVMYPSGLRAEWIQALASTTMFEFRGTLQVIGAGYRIIDGHRVTVTSETKLIGDAKVGDIVECRALEGSGGVLLATLIRVLSPAEDARIIGSIAAIRAEPDGTASWDVVVAPDDPIGDPRVVRVNVNGNTWVDQSASVAEPGKWAEVRGTATQADSYQAGMIRVEGRGRGSLPQATAAQQTAEASAMPWGVPTTIIPGQSNAEHPMLAYTPDRVTHAVWESDSRLYYSSQPPGAAWGAPVLIAYGFAPHLVADSAGTLHVAFVNLFMGNYDTYYIVRSGGSWSLPVNMAYTTGYSAHPKLALASDHTLHAVWMDNTPGYWTTYYANWDGQFWSNRPIPSGRGQSPAISAPGDGAINVVWQDRVTRDAYSLGDFDIFLSVLRDGTWAPPLDISDSRALDSLGPDITSTADNQGHIVWVDNEWTVFYSYGQRTTWSAPQVVATVLDNGYAKNPHVISEAGKYLHIAWEEEGDVGRANALRVASKQQQAPSWPLGYAISSNNTFRDAALTAIPSGGVGLSWVEVNNATGASLWASRREPMHDYRLWVPIILSAVQSGN